MPEIAFFGPHLRVAGTARILEDKAGLAVFDSNHNGQADPQDDYVIAENQACYCSGRVPIGFDNLRAHAGNLGRASSREIAESMTRHEYAGTAMRITDVVPQKAPENLHSTIFHFEESAEPYAEFLVSHH